MFNCNVTVLNHLIMQLSDPVRPRLQSKSDDGLEGDKKKDFIETILQYQATSCAL